MPILKYFFALLIICCTGWNQCAAQCSPTPDQGQIFNTTGIISVGTDEWSQSITAGRTGQLTGIQFQIENPSVLPAQFAFSLHAGGNPTMGQPLYSLQLTISSADLEDPGLYTWDVTNAQLFFDAGDVFTFAFSVQQAGVEIAGNSTPGYDGGELYINGNAVPPFGIQDIAFISYVCVENGPACSQRHKLIPGDGSAGDRFGRPVAMSGSIAVLGAYLDDENGNNSGSAYLFATSTFQQIHKLLPDDGTADDRFGSGVGISGNIVMVGAYGDDDNGENSGSAYLFDAITGQQIHKLVPNDGAAGDGFGLDVAISGNIAIAGAYHDDDNGENSGAAYLFDAITGQQIHKLLPNDGAADYRFGMSVAISDEIAIVGSHRDNENGFASGSAYLFDLATGNQIAKLLPDDGMSHDEFGRSVAISDNTAIVGARDNSSNSAGAAYLFDVSTGSQITKLLPIDVASGDGFGSDVGIGGKIAIVGANGDDDNGDSSGSAYLFDITTGQQLSKLLPDDGEPGDWFGISVAISGFTALVGASKDDDNGLDSGSAYFFDIGDCVGSASVPPDSYLVTRGDYVSGGIAELAESDNLDLSLRRLTSDIQSRTEFSVKAISPTAMPTSLEVTLEGSVFARSQVNQTIELYDYVAGSWEPIYTSAATRFTDSAVTVAAAGDLSRFVQPGTMCIQARIRYRSPVARQQFSSNTDQFIWTIGQ